MPIGYLLVGGFALGAAIACLVAFFLNRFSVFNAKVLGSVVSVIAGGVVTAFLGVDKQYAWVGYCCGLGFILFLFVLAGHLDVARGGDSRKDTRLQMLDALRKRYVNSAIDSKDYEAMKEAILADIRKNPAMSESDQNRPLGSQ